MDLAELEITKREGEDLNEFEITKGEGKCLA